MSIQQELALQVSLDVVEEHDPIQVVYLMLDAASFETDSLKVELGSEEIAGSAGYLPIPIDPGELIGNGKTSFFITKGGLTVGGDDWIDVLLPDRLRRFISCSGDSRLSHNDHARVIAGLIGRKACSIVELADLDHAMDHNVHLFDFVYRSADFTQDRIRPIDRVKG
jgi:hypothetical protein